MPYKDPQKRAAAASAYYHNIGKYNRRRKRMENRPLPESPRRCLQCNILLTKKPGSKRPMPLSRKYCTLTCRMIANNKWQSLALDRRRDRLSNEWLHIGDPQAVHDGPFKTKPLRVAKKNKTRFGTNPSYQLRVPLKHLTRHKHSTSIRAKPLRFPAPLHGAVPLGPRGMPVLPRKRKHPSDRAYCPSTPQEALEHWHNLGLLSKHPSNMQPGDFIFSPLGALSTGFSTPHLTTRENNLPPSDDLPPDQ